MTYETLLEKAHRLVDSMDETRLENFVMRYDDTVSVKDAHPLFQLAGILSHEEAQEIRSEKMTTIKNKNIEERYCTVEESLIQSLKEVKLMQSGLMPKKPWKQTKAEVEEYIARVRNDEEV